jgi:hypothetical protein
MGEVPGLLLSRDVIVNEPAAIPFVKQYAVLLVGPIVHENARWVHVLNGLVPLVKLPPVTGPPPIYILGVPPNVLKIHC